MLASVGFRRGDPPPNAGGSDDVAILNGAAVLTPPPTDQSPLSTGPNDYLFPILSPVHPATPASTPVLAPASASLELAALYATLSSSMPPALDTNKVEPTAIKDFDFVNFNADLCVFPFDIVPNVQSYPSLSGDAVESALQLDAQLDSPLGLASSIGTADDSPYSQYIVSPMFASPELPHLDAASLFPSLASVYAANTASATFTRPNPPPPARPFAPLPTRAQSDSSISSASASPSPRRADSLSSSSAASSKKPDLTGFSSGPLLPLDAPIQPRTYFAPSATSRKHTLTAVEREAQKRQRAADADHDGDATPSFAQEVVASIEKKRTQNTMAARRSRARKQLRLGELEDKTERLEDENAALRARVALLEGVMKTMGLTPP